MENTGSIVGRKAQRAHQAVDDVAQRASAKAGPAIDRAAQAAHQAVDKVTPAAEWIAQSADQLRRQQDEFAVACRGYVRERPLIAIATALTAGFLIGRLAR